MKLILILGAVFVSAKLIQQYFIKQEDYINELESLDHGI